MRQLPIFDGRTDFHDKIGYFLQAVSIDDMIVEGGENHMALFIKQNTVIES